MPTLELETMYCTLDGPLARLRLNRPEALNAGNWAWVKDLVTATNYLKQSAATRVVLVGGEGRAFCSGLDVKELSQGYLSVEWFDLWERGVTALEQLDAVTIAAVQGYCLGGGLQLAIACDLLVSSEDAIYSIPAVREGVVADLGPMRLAHMIGMARAKYLCLLGKRFSAQEALALGIVHEVVPLAEMDARAQALAQELLAIPFTALKHTKRQINNAFEKDTVALTSDLLQAQEECLASPEHAAVMERYRVEQAEHQRQKAASKKIVQ
ncbi:MAG TPA: enoyl-CoA hydratase/isomerase family protein [Ktedonobacteraceae bacterium]|nr:enoyl-CoA hydratase/isomerase family protein [Ktedonobacteraceae bacterium]